VTFPDIGARLQTLSLACGARRILEIGSGAGHSTLALATTLPSDGMMITMEIDATRASQVRERLGAAGHDHRVSVMVGDATRFLHKVAGPFDFIFLDGDQRQYDQMLDRLVDLLRPGGLLVIDRLGGRDADDTGAAFRQRLAADSRLQTPPPPVDDGVSVSIKRAS
jgi:caffeoyl-CoA O-methyltransferase